MTEGTGLQIEGIYRLHLSSETKKANAALAGLGRTRRVLLGDSQVIRAHQHAAGAKKGAFQNSR